MDLIINRQLFSAVYLRELQLGRYAADVLDGARQTIREWRVEYSDLSDPADRNAYVKQCLSALGVASYPRPERDGFIFYSDAAKTRLTGLCLVTADADLGRAVKGDHPQAHLIRELRKASAHWGILSNGASWRLCYAAAPAPYEAFLEVDLDAVLRQHPGLQEFLLFYRLYGSEAFAAQETGIAAQRECGLDRILAESERRTEAIERHLKSQVEPILQKLCLGFVEDEAAGGYDVESLQVIYQNAIYLLYRILFLFYAEARGLLPVENTDYRPVGLSALVESARLREQEGITASDPFSLWRRLTRLFVVVDDGDDRLGVAAYNGGLFSDLEKPYLKRHKIRDEYLAPALFVLGYESKGKNGSTALSTPLLIDYRDLSVRHLGTLYEGLLEYRLNLVEREPRVVRESGGKRVFIPMSAAAPVKKGETILEVGQVYFADDKGERKASGSYYTPEDVVQYIVGNTVTPKLEEARKPYDIVRAEVERERIIAPTPEQRRQLESYADQKALETIERSILHLRILDPAMGSGHFLVAAAQTVTDFIIETLNATDWPNEEISTDPLFWKRRVVERCIYGVDKNPLAHELAKLSLWIASAAAGKPLTFLDHHLKCGNSLYGTPLSRLSALPGKSKGDDGLFRLVREQMISDALKQMSSVTQIDSDTIETVKQKEVANRTAGKTVQRLRMVADLWLATLFGLKTEGDDRAINAEEYNGFLNDLTANYAEEAWAHRVRNSYILQQAQRIAEQNSFFHWELEFPDSVVNGECRFDAVIANPPYVGMKPTATIKALYQTAQSADLYAWLFERVMSVSRDYGYAGVVVPLSIMFGWEMTPLRSMLLHKEYSLHICCFDNVPEGLFNTGKANDNTSKQNMQRTAIILVQSTPGISAIKTTSLLRWWSSERTELFDKLRYSDVTNHCTAACFPHIGDDRLSAFWTKLKNSGCTLSDISTDIMYEGRKPKSNEICLTVPRAVGYFISATPGLMARSKALSATFANEYNRDVAQVLINSNIFFWYWRSFGDGFLLGVDLIKDFPIPEGVKQDKSVLEYARRLNDATEQCTTFKMYRGEKIPSFNFNKRMDILLDIDEWIVRHVAPDLNLPRDIFAQYKSNSFLRPLDLSALVANAEEEDGDRDE